MLKTLKKISLVLICLCLCIGLAGNSFGGFVPKADAVNGESTIQQDKQHLAELREKLKNIENNLAEMNKNNANIQAGTQTMLEEKIALEEEYNLINGKVSTISDIISSYNGIIETAREDSEKLQAELDKQLEDFGTVLAELYKNGDDSKFEIFLRSDSYYSYISYVEYMKSILKSSDDMIADIKVTLDELEARKQEYEDSKVKLEENKKELVLAQEELKAKDEELDRKLGEARDQLILTEHDREKQKLEEQQLLKDIQELQKQIQDKLSATYTGKFSWPFSSNVSYYISSRYGPRPNGPFGSDFHNGIDIACARGTPIHAVESGIVVYSNPRGAFGNVVFIEHDGGLTTIYAHCDSLLVTAGTKVLKDQVIARVGSTGQSTGNHLHFAVRKNGVYVNPENYLPEYYTR